jgi:hypothetical protein
MILAVSQLSADHLRPPGWPAGYSARVSVIVVGGGYGKSALAAEAAEFLDMPVIATALESAGVSAALLPDRLRSAAARVAVPPDDASARLPGALARRLPRAYGALTVRLRDAFATLSRRLLAGLAGKPVTPARGAVGPGFN